MDDVLTNDLALCVICTEYSLLDGDDSSSAPGGSAGGD